MASASNHRPVRARLGLRLAALALCAAGCSSADRVAEPTFPPPTFGERDSVFSDNQLFVAAYSSYTVPADFYQEPASDVGHIYLHNMRLVNGVPQPEWPWTELSTEDPVLARAWADTFVANIPFQGPIADAPPLVSERYFEFTDVPGARTLHARYRVHRSSYVTDVQTMLASVSMGRALATFRVRPVETANVRPFVEYLWTQRDGYVQGQKVLSSFATDAPTEVTHSMYILLLLRNPNGRDRIQLKRFTYHVSKSSGVVTGSSATIRYINGGVHFGRPGPTSP